MNSISPQPLLTVRNLSVSFDSLAALRDINFELNAGETVGLVGESGAGKSTLARVIVGLQRASGGRVEFQGVNLLNGAGAFPGAQRRHLQMVFQDPLSSLDPRMTVEESIGEPLRVFEPQLSAHEWRDRVSAALARVGLERRVAHRYPHQFSGGQCQRIGIARATILNPRLLICDEAVSSLDASIQGQIVNLLRDLQREMGMAMLFISHNLAVVRHVSHRVMVLRAGEMVEIAPADTLFSAPGHPYTRTLLAAVPRAPSNPLS
jgi:oligopeptide transport system ATP-binding protein